MIQGFRHRGHERFFLSEVKSGIRSDHADRLRIVLGRLAAATAPKDMDLPGLRLHPLQGRFEGRWSVTISGNWRVTFAFSGKDVLDVDYEDYH